MSEETWATIGLIVVVACMIAMGVFLATLKFPYGA